MNTSQSSGEPSQTNGRSADGVPITEAKPSENSCSFSCDIDKIVLSSCVDDGPASLAFRTPAATGCRSRSNSSTGEIHSIGLIPKMRWTCPPGRWQHAGMREPASIHLTRTDPACNMARFYHLELQADLFGGITLVRRWGRIGGSGQQRQSWFPTLPEAEATLSAWLRRKLARGYLTGSHTTEK